MRLFFKRIFSKKVFKFLFCILCTLFLLLSPNFIFNKNNFINNFNKFLKISQKEQVVLNVWHIETFEGGVKSRKKFLEEAGIKFNKNNPNLFISVTSLTEEQLFLNLKNGLTADAFSFSIGSGYLLSSQLEELEENKNINKNLQRYGKIENKIFAYPYMLSCYIAISKDSSSLLLKEKLNLKNKNTLGFGFATEDYINPAKVLVNNNVTGLDESKFYNCQTSYNAYSNFVGGKFKTLIGTMRDYYRCKNREELGKLSNCCYEYLSGYTDLIQYIGINKNCNNKTKEVAKSYLNYLLSSNSQTNLKNYGLFSSTQNCIYSNVFLHNIEQNLANNINSINVFSSYDKINNNKKESLKIIFSNN